MILEKSEYIKYHFLISTVYNYFFCRLFQDIVQYCKNYIDLIPLSFVLGFYVSIVMTRWWGQYTTIPFPDNLAVFVSTTVHGQVKYLVVVQKYHLNSELNPCFSSN